MKTLDSGLILPDFFKWARREANLSNHPDFKMGASIHFKKSQVISIGKNDSNKTHPLITEHLPFAQTVHAELAALMGVRNKDTLIGATMVVYRERKDGSLGMARPCPSCMSLLKKYGFKKIIYTTPEGYEEEKI